MAIEIYDQVPKSSPLRVTSEVRIALLYAAMGKADESVKQLRAIVKDHPDNVDAVSALADVLRSEKKFQDSADAYTHVLALTAPDDKSRWAIYYFRGVDYERAKQWSKAEPDLKEALDLYPEQPMVLNYLGYSWVDQGIHLDEAFKMLRRAVELEPEDGYIVDSLGWAYYKLGRYDEAVKIWSAPSISSRAIRPSTTISATPIGRWAASWTPGSSGTTRATSSRTLKTCPRS